MHGRHLLNHSSMPSITVHVIVQPQYYSNTTTMFHFSFGFSLSYGQSISASDLLEKMDERFKALELKGEERYQEFQLSRRKQNTEITKLKEHLGDVEEERDMYKEEYEKLSEKYSELTGKYKVMKKKNHKLEWEKGTMEKGMKNTFVVPRKWTQRKIRKYRGKHEYKGYEETESDLEEEQYK